MISEPCRRAAVALAAETEKEVRMTNTPMPGDPMPPMHDPQPSPQPTRQPPDIPPTVPQELPQQEPQELPPTNPKGGAALPIDRPGSDAIPEPAPDVVPLPVERERPK